MSQISEIITFDKDAIKERAEKYFAKICGFDGKKEEKYKRMLEHALKIRDKSLDKINVRALIYSFEGKNLKGKTLTLNGTPFHCNAFEKFRGENIRGIYPYILTAGDIQIEDAPVLEIFYADTWGTAYVDAARDFLREMINDKAQSFDRETKIFVSDSFGPGYYGMETEQISNFFKVMDAEKIGIKLTKNGMMIPLKSCIGIYIVTDDETQLPKVDCRECISNPGGCQFCRMNKV